MKKRNQINVAIFWATEVAQVKRLRNVVDIDSAKDQLRSFAKANGITEFQIQVWYE